MQSECTQLERRLREPVRVAIVGPVNSGKSTLVNALLGQRVAPTNKSECTRLVELEHVIEPAEASAQKAFEFCKVSDCTSRIVSAST